MEIRKIYKAGNSLVFSIPKEYLEALGLREGGNLAVYCDQATRSIVARPVDVEQVTIDPAFAARVEGFIDRYERALKALAR
ncbi:MAG: AbrB/MazE/SpoVT family DNA-binding domain-containing protein [Bacillota bacterium]